MNRAPMTRGTKPMARSAILAGAELRRGDQPMARSPVARSTTRMKTRRPKPTKIRQSAKGEECTLRFVVCRNRTDTTVWCHSNRIADGKGTGIKADDEAGCYGCAACHAYLDYGWAQDPEMTFELVQERFEQARYESRIRLENKGLIPA